MNLKFHYFMNLKFMFIAEYCQVNILTKMLIFIHIYKYKKFLFLFNVSYSQFTYWKV